GAPSPFARSFRLIIQSLIWDAWSNDPTNPTRIMRDGTFGSTMIKSHLAPCAESSFVRRPLVLQRQHCDIIRLRLGLSMTCYFLSPSGNHFPELPVTQRRHARPQPFPGKKFLLGFLRLGDAVSVQQQHFAGLKSN